MASRITGVVESIDPNGNLITNITSAMLADAPRDAATSILCDEHETYGIFSANSDQPPMTFVAILGPQDRLELAIVEESAALMLGIVVGAQVEVRW